MQEIFDGLPSAPRRHPSRRAPLAASAALAVVVATLFFTGWVTVYDGPGNAGVVIGPNCHNIGYEWRGNPGLFADSCS